MSVEELPGDGLVEWQHRIDSIDSWDPITTEEARVRLGRMGNVDDVLVGELRYRLITPWIENPECGWSALADGELPGDGQRLREALIGGDELDPRWTWLGGAAERLRAHAPADEDPEAVLECAGTLETMRQDLRAVLVRDTEREHGSARGRLSECCGGEVRFGGGTGVTRYYVCSVCEKACGLATGDAQREHEPAKVNVPGRRVIEDDGTEGNMVVASVYSREQGIIDALRILQNRTIGSPEACERAIDRLLAAAELDHAEVLAKALDQFFTDLQLDVGFVSPQGPVDELSKAVEPTLQALGYPKEAGS